MSCAGFVTAEERWGELLQDFVSMFIVKHVHDLFRCVKQGKKDVIVVVMRGNKNECE